MDFLFYANQKFSKLCNVLSVLFIFVFPVIEGVALLFTLWTTTKINIILNLVLSISAIAVLMLLSFVFCLFVFGYISKVLEISDKLDDLKEQKTISDDLLYRKN